MKTLNPKPRGYEVDGDSGCSKTVVPLFDPRSGAFLHDGLHISISLLEPIPQRQHSILLHIYFPQSGLELHTTAQAAKENTAMHATQNYVNGTAGW